MGESRGGSLLWVSLGGELTMGESRGRGSLLWVSLGGGKLTMGESRGGAYYG